MILNVPSLADKDCVAADESLRNMLMVALFKVLCAVLSLNTPFIEPVFWLNACTATKVKITAVKSLYFIFQVYTAIGMQTLYVCLKQKN